MKKIKERIEELLITTVLGGLLWGYLALDVDLLNEMMKGLMP